MLSDERLAEMREALADGRSLSTTSALELLAEVDRLRAENERLREALHWCGGSPSFAPGGEAEVGWDRLCRPLLEAEEKP